MGWCFRKRLKIIPGVYVNFSKSGISTSVGIPGASVTFGKNGTYTNFGIPGTGIYNRRRITNNRSERESGYQPEVMHGNDSYREVEISSSDVLTISDQGLTGIKESIEFSRNQRREIKSDIAKIENLIRWNRTKKNLCYLLYPLLKDKIQRISEDITSQSMAIEELNLAHEDSYVDVEVDFTPQLKNSFDSLIDLFKSLAASEAIWDITSSQQVDAIRERSSAGAAIRRTKVSFGFNSLEDLRISHQVPFMENANGLNIYFYPNFVVLYSGGTQLAVVDINDIEVTGNVMKFMESEKIPSDSEILRYTWYRVNKDGSRDKRFKENFEIPVVKYCELYIKSKSGINECYHISNYDAADRFVKSLEAYKAEIKNNH